MILVIAMRISLWHEFLRGLEGSNYRRHKNNYTTDSKFFIITCTFNYNIYYTNGTVKSFTGMEL